MMSRIVFLALASVCSAAVVRQFGSFGNLGGFPANNFGSVNFDNFNFGTLGVNPAESPDGTDTDPVVVTPPVGTNPPAVTTKPVGPGPPVKKPFTPFNFFGAGKGPRGKPVNNVPVKKGGGDVKKGNTGGGFNFPAGFGGGATFGGTGFGGGFGFR